MRKLLCATDLSTRADRAVRRAALLARQYAADLLLLHVVDDDQPKHFVEARLAEARAHLETDAARAPGGPGSVAAIEVVAGHASETIARYARDWNAELIVMGVHRRRVLLDVFVGTTLERVVRADRLPVLVVSSDYPGAYQRVLLALDASAASARAVRTARDFDLLGGDIAVVHAWEPVYAGALEGAGAIPETAAAYAGNWSREAHERLQGFLREVGLAVRPFDLQVERGPPFDAIRGAVEKRAPHLLVIGTRGLGGIARALLGSVAEQVLRAIECDILVVPRA
ncbi:MAG: universal stress protein [Steroidobacteraceae bacterium]